MDIIESDTRHFEQYAARGVPINSPSIQSYGTHQMSTGREFKLENQVGTAQNSMTTTHEGFSRKNLVPRPSQPLE